VSGVCSSHSTLLTFSPVSTPHDIPFTQLSKQLTLTKYLNFKSNGTDEQLPFHFWCDSYQDKNGVPCYMIPTNDIDQMISNWVKSLIEFAQQITSLGKINIHIVIMMLLSDCSASCKMHLITARLLQQLQCTICLVAFVSQR
jgi:hypothetical protein